MNIGTSGTTHNDNGLYLLNTTVKFGHVSQGIVIRSFLSWEATANAIDSAGTIPTAGLFRPVVTGEGTCHCIGVDFANMGSNPLVDIVVACNAKYVFEDCKIASGTTFTNGDGTLDDVFSRSGTTVTATNCDDSDNFRYYKKSFRGEIASETTIVRTSPANATDGTTPCSRKMIGIGACFEDPLKSDWMEFWNETTGSAVTPLIAITSDAHLTQGQCWLEVECLSSSGCPLGVFSSSVEGDIITPGTTALTTDGDSTWASGKAHNYTISKAVTPTVKGLIRCRVCLATTDTLYFDPLPLAGARQFQSKDRHIQYPAATGGGGTRAWASIG